MRKILFLNSKTLATNSGNCCTTSIFFHFLIIHKEQARLLTFKRASSGARLHRVPT